MSLINKMNVGNADYDIQDRLMPDAIGQAGQVLKVKDDGSGLEFSTIESSGVQFVEAHGNPTLTEEQLATLKANKANQIIYYGGVKYYFKLAYEKSTNEWVYDTFVNDAVTLTVNMTTGSATLDINGAKLYRHFIKMNNSVDGFSAIYFDSYRSKSYTFSELYNYIIHFVNYSFTALINLEDNTTAYLYNAKVEALNEKIIIWYSTTYGTDMSHRKSVTEVTSDTVIEL